MNEEQKANMFSIDAAIPSLCTAAELFTTLAWLAVSCDVIV